MARNENTESYIVGLTFFATHNSPVTRVVTIDLSERAQLTAVTPDTLSLTHIADES